jgi:hypothetical protein
MTELIYHECDQIGADIRESVQEMWHQYEAMVTLDYETVERMMTRVNITYPVEEFEELLEHVLDKEERIEPFVGPMQRTGYKKCLGKIYGRRSAEAQKRNRAWMKQHGFE